MNEYNSTKLFKGYNSIQTVEIKHSHCQFLHGVCNGFKVTFTGIRSVKLGL